MQAAGSQFAAASAPSQCSDRQITPPSPQMPLITAGNRPFALPPPPDNATPATTPLLFFPALPAGVLNIDCGECSTALVKSGKYDGLQPHSDNLAATTDDMVELNMRTRELDAAWRMIKTAMEMYERSSAWASRKDGWSIECKGYLPGITQLPDRLSTPLEQFTEDPLFARCLRLPATMGILQPRLIAWCEASAKTCKDPGTAVLYQDAAIALAHATFDDILAHPRLRGLLTALQSTTSNSIDTH